MQTALEKAVAKRLENGDNKVLVKGVTYNVRVQNNRVDSVFPVLPD